NRPCVRTNRKSVLQPCRTVFQTVPASRLDGLEIRPTTRRTHGHGLGELVPHGRDPRSVPPGAGPAGRARDGTGKGRRLANPHSTDPRARPGPRSRGGRHQRRNHPCYQRRGCGVPWEKGPHSPDPLARLDRLGTAGPGHHPGLAHAGASQRKEIALKLKITIDGKVYEVEVEVAEPEPPQPGYVPPAAQTRVPAPKPV